MKSICHAQGTAQAKSPSSTCSSVVHAVPAALRGRSSSRARPRSELSSGTLGSPSEDVMIVAYSELIIS